MQRGHGEKGKETKRRRRKKNPEQITPLSPVFHSVTCSPLLSPPPPPPSPPQSLNPSVAMDWVLSCADEYVLTPYVYPAQVPEDNMLRQLASLFVIVSLGAIVMYFILASLSYVFIFDKELRKHKKFLQDQVRFHGRRLELEAMRKAILSKMGACSPCLAWLASRPFGDVWMSAISYGT
jgi:hypothetical protein